MVSNITTKILIVYTTENIIPIDYVSMSVGHLVHVLLIVYNSTEHVVKFDDCTFSRFGSSMPTDTQTDADERFTPATLVGMNKDQSKSFG